MRVVILALAVVSFGLAAPAFAQPANVPEMIQLIDNQPNDMDRSTWKEKRRDAARKLAQSKDRRATPVLIRLAESETFDIIGEIAIEGLGTMGDKAAVPTLQAIVADTTRDKTSRDLARKALARLGAPETAAGTATGTGTKPGPGTGTTATTTTTGGASGGTTGTTGGTTGTRPGGGTTATTGTRPGGTTGTTGTTTGSAGTTAGTGTTTGPNVATVETGDLEGGEVGASGSGLLGERPATTIEGTPELEDDVIAASNRLIFTVGTIGLRVQKTPADNAPPEQSPDSRIDFDADVAAYYQRRLDTETKAYAVDAGAHLVAGWINPEGSGQSRAVLLNLDATGEARFYSNNFYGIGKAAAAFAMTYIGLVDVSGGGTVTTTKDASSQLDLQIALGGGYGRIVDVGGAMRVRRLAALLDAARALGKPIDAATAKRLQLTWWALRGERATFRALLATIAILREAGVLLGEPNAVITYEILTVLRDTQLYARPQGFDAQLVIGEGYLKRPRQDNGNCVLPSCGRVEQVIATVGYASQVDDDKLEISGSGFARYRLFTPDDSTPAPWAVGAGGRMRRFTYGEHGDPFGALDIAGRVRLSSDGFDQMATGRDSDLAMRLEAELGFTYWINQASGLRLAAQAAVDQGTFYLGARLEGTYGLLDAIYAR